MDLATSISLEQRQHELWFGCCLFAGSADIALRTCMWLDPGIFIDKNLGQYWGKVRNGEDPLASANDLRMTDLFMRHFNDVPNLIRPEEYARQIGERAYYHRAVMGAQGIIKAVNIRSSADVRHVAERLSQDNLGDGDGAYTADDIGVEFESKLDSGMTGTVMTYIPGVDRALGGLFPRDLIVLAGRPGIGKTALLLQFARNVAAAKLGKVLFFSLEMSRTQLWARMACGNAGIAWRDVRSGAASQADIASVKKHSELLRQSLGDLFIVQDEVYTIGHMAQIVATIKPVFVLIDHLGEIEWDDPKEKEVTWYGKACKAIRHLIAKRFGVPVVLAHQLNRDVEGRDDKRPQLADLRWSGEVEQRADVVLMLYRDGYYDKELQEAERLSGISAAELLVRKNRQGDVNTTIPLSYKLLEQWFE